MSELIGQDQDALFRDMLVQTHRLPHSKRTRPTSDIGRDFVPREVYRRQLEVVGFKVVPDRLRNSGQDCYKDGKYIADAPLPHPPAVYGIQSMEKSKTIAVVYPEGWQAVVAEDDPRRFQIVDQVGDLAVAVFAELNSAANSGFPVFRVAIRGFDEQMRV